MAAKAGLSCPARRWSDLCQQRQGPELEFAGRQRRAVNGLESTCRPVGLRMIAVTHRYSISYVICRLRVGHYHFVGSDQRRLRDVRSGAYLSTQGEIAAFVRQRRCKSTACEALIRMGAHRRASLSGMDKLSSVSSASGSKNRGNHDTSVRYYLA